MVSVTTTVSHTAYVALGSNLGQRMAYLQAALRDLHTHADIGIDAVSPVYETAPVSPVPQGAYLNAVIRVRTHLDALALLYACLAVEQQNGRVRTERFGPRTLDLDVLWHSGQEQCTDETLTLPHPRLHERAFVLTPLADVAPGLTVRGKTVSAWLALCSVADRASVIRTAEKLVLPAALPSE